MIHAFDEFELDESLFELRRRGVEVVLRRKSFEVLVYLVRNRHRVVSKDEIFERVWPDTAVCDSSLANCVSEIRAALGDRRDTACMIQTVYGRGYRFVARLEDAGRLASAPPQQRAATHGSLPLGARQPELQRLSQALCNALGASGNVVVLLLGEQGLEPTSLEEGFPESASPPSIRDGPR